MPGAHRRARSAAHHTIRQRPIPPSTPAHHSNCMPVIFSPDWLHDSPGSVLTYPDRSGVWFRRLQVVQQDLELIGVNHPRTELGCACGRDAVHAAVAGQHHIDAWACLDCDDERSELSRQGTIRSLKHACWCRDVSSSPPRDAFLCHGGIHRKPLTCAYASPPSPHRPPESTPYKRLGGFRVENL